MIQSSLLQNKPSTKGPVLQCHKNEWLGRAEAGLCPSEWAEALTGKHNIWHFSSQQHWQLLEVPLIPPQLSIPACTASPPLPAVQTSYLWGQTKNQMRIIFNSNQFTYVFSTVLTDSCINTSEGVTQGQDQAARMKQGKGTWTGQGLCVPTAPTKKTQPKVSTWPSQLQLHEVIMWSCQSSISLQARCIDKNNKERGQVDPRFGTSSSGLSGFAESAHTPCHCAMQKVLPALPPPSSPASYNLWLTTSANPFAPCLR